MDGLEIHEWLNLLSAILVILTEIGLSLETQGAIRENDFVTHLR